MSIPTQPVAGWPLWQKFLFRFFFIFWILCIAPWTWFEVIPGISYLVGWSNQAMDWVVNNFNKYLFHVKDKLVPINGSGDTSYGWAQLCTFLVVSFAGALIWSAVERKKSDYVKLNYWLCLVVRYNIALVCFSYGFIKIFNLQMPFPSYSELATPLGDLLPMRLSWLFMGYSGIYQGFSGALEVIAGLLLLYRRTTTLGSLLAAGVFLNVAMLNISYDIPVKIFSIEIFLMCVFLLVIDRKRLIDFFLLNKTAPPSTLYDYSPRKKWARITKTVMKLGMVCLGAGASLYQSITWYQQSSATNAKPPLYAGLYDVTTFAINKDTIPAYVTDSLRWQNVAIENYGQGSLAAKDTLFYRGYNRSYFSYETDTSKHTIAFRKFAGPEAPGYSFAYDQPDSNTIRLRGKKGVDSLFVVLKKSNRHFQLAEKQFHWLSEHNR
jgi:uncharacterized membrane protein YphA (DoxX/SURF4 family)